MIPLDDTHVALLVSFIILVSNVVVTRIYKQKKKTNKTNLKKFENSIIILSTLAQCLILYSFIRGFFLHSVSISILISIIITLTIFSFVNLV
jgi:hypothetical protein